jgi:phosphotriesterase-related protein
MHEHLLIDIRPPPMRMAMAVEDEEPVQACDCFKLTWGQKSLASNRRLDQPDIILAELSEMHAAGGRALVELTVGGLRPDPNGLAALSQKSGVHVVMGCGHYVEAYQDEANANRSADDFAREMIEQLTVGAWGTEVKAGIIGEIGCQAPWTPQERRVMQGALTAQAETGAAVNAHPGRSPDQPFELAAYVREFGAPADRFIISHLDRTFSDLDQYLRLADTGVVIELDLFGLEVTNYYLNPDIDLPNDGARLKLIRGMIERGHLERIVISHDICTRNRLCHYGGHGYQHIFANIVPLMLRRGFDQAEIDALLVGNPARLLTFR